MKYDKMKVSITSCILFFFFSFSPLGKCLPYKLTSFLLSFFFFLPGGVQQRNSGDSAVHCLCVWSVHEWTRRTVPRLSTSQWLAACFLRACRDSSDFLMHTLQLKHYVQLNTQNSLPYFKLTLVFIRPTITLWSYLLLVECICLYIAASVDRSHNVSQPPVTDMFHVHYRNSFHQQSVEKLPSKTETLQTTCIHLDPPIIL